MTNASLNDTNLTNVVLQGATLPDGTRWTEETDMARFTDPNHLDFWDVCIEATSKPRYCP